MSEKYILGEFNASNNLNLNNIDRKSIIIKRHVEKLPLINKLLENSSEFYSDFFTHLISRIDREQRYLVFETPNRVKITHEYTLDNPTLDSGYYFLFNPQNRLDWLKIFIEDERVSIAPKSILFDKLKIFLKDELNYLSFFLNMEVDSILHYLYENCTGKPCFIEFNKKSIYENQVSIFIRLEYYQTLDYIDKNWYDYIFPINERKIEYHYTPLKKEVSSWLYLKAPLNFEIKRTNKVNNVEYPKSIDPEIQTAVFRNQKSIKFKYNIDVPKSLKKWFYSILTLTFILDCLLILKLIDKYDVPSKFQYLTKFSKTNNFFSNIDNSLFLSLSLALIAAIITIRGWLIIEETILKKISNLNSFLMIITTLLLISIYI